MELEKITVNRIAERATINRVTFYLHYKDIPDMVERMADDMIREFHAVLQDIPNEPHAETSWTILVSIIEHIAEHAAFYKIVLASKRIPAFTDRLMNLMVELISSRAENRIASLTVTSVNVPKDIAIWYGSSALIGTIVYWLRSDMPYTPLFLAKQLSILFRLPQNAAE
ncbi:TetR/AcrR family transcriptional regulator [Paenibacillus rhizovicinus]|uniref:TetR/AcrR family transcriptional regulator n=2 Tax=Paenibacillus rhizovicinus TaxID=2704463 RepID=A0A6C0P9G1_9BACL|nr:TetR/AcrR family transcriptional regulator [Paenibacillus rhizovicinus]